jgi:predicted RNase H-like HicB family nuclease
MKTLLFDNVVWQEGEHFVAQCLNVDVSSFGNSKNEALDNLKEALELYFEDSQDTFNPISKAEIVQAEIFYA